jgi:hypothetical protein
MRVFWFHLSNLFLAVTTPSQFGFLGFGNDERHPGFRLMQRHRGLESALRTTFRIGRIRRINEDTRLSPVDTLQKRLYRL